ncbi:MAG: hypothetical protein ACLR6B_20835 [Blautia sp.]
MTFLSIVAVACLFICVNYLKLQAQVTESRKQISRMESSYSDLKLSNDAAYSKAVSSVDLDTIRDIAINELGMVYANQDQIVTYDKAGQRLCPSVRGSTEGIVHRWFD